MARKTATEDDHPPPPPKRPIQTSDRKRKRNPAKDVPVEDQPNRKRKQIPYQTSTQTLKVGGYPSHTKGNNEVIDTNTSDLRNKPGTGYLTACFAMMVGPKGRAVGIEHIPELTDQSVKNIQHSK